MKFLSFNKWPLALTLSAKLASTAVYAKNLRTADNISNHPQQRILIEDEIGTFLIADIQYDEASRRLNGNGNGRPDRTYNIESANGEIFELTNVNPAFLEGKVKGLSSGETMIKINKGASKGQGKIDLKGGMPEVVGAGHGLFDRNLNGEISEEQHRRRAELQRQLKIGNKTVLAVKVIASDEAYSTTEEALSDDVFGNGVDTFNLVKGYDQCSYGQLTFDKAADQSASGLTISNGVVTVTVPNAATEGDGVLRNAVTSALNAAFGSATSLANHLMYCLPTSAMSGIAYAYINSWNSVYKDQWCNKPSAQMHELGHNLNFAHSNEAGSYKDQSGMMGYSYNQDEGPVMCFNAAKSYQTGWYTDGTIVVSPESSGPGDCLTDHVIYGIVDYDYYGLKRNVLIKIDSASGPSYFVNFNRKTGFNSGTVEGGNQVMIVSTTSGEGTSYAESELLAKLSMGGVYTISDFGGSGSGIDVTVSVSVIDLTSPAYAMISISHPGSTCDPATESPTTSPTKKPTKSPTTSPTKAPSASPTPEPTSSPTSSSAPSVTPTTSPPTTSPTKNPTMNPTTSPTEGPTGSPTFSPTKKPTVSPTKSPTQQPTVTPNCSDLGDAGNCNHFSHCSWVAVQGNGSCKDLGTCDPFGGDCTLNSDCCSGNCKGNGTCKPL